jgi:hypothetical protein
MDEAVLYTMDDLDHALDREDIKMVSINIKGIEKDYGLYGLPLLIHFNGNIPRVFDGLYLAIMELMKPYSSGELADEGEFQKFILESLTKSDIEEVNGDVLDRLDGFSSYATLQQCFLSLVDRLPNMAAVFYDSENPENVDIIAKLEDIDDDCDNNGIPFVKIEDIPKANDEFGLGTLPAVLYWKNSKLEK